MKLEFGVYIMVASEERQHHLLMFQKSWQRDHRSKTMAGLEVWFLQKLWDRPLSLVSYEIVFYCKCIHLNYVKMKSTVWKGSISFLGFYNESFKYINLSIFESLSPRFQLPKFGNCLILFFLAKHA
ncbi:hypothetical protein Dsin_027210 [Dipteronia sinensis]|uniref:Uncharacterized protein n=1 Tax=Dipteronia sinensis TaxID=43782 RepID=A0AAE0DYK2_9ROSI|nr:hypothetical protein Dsin_027210 [Dipteronia sinensis]